MAIVLDLETVGDESVAVEIGEVKAPKNYTKQESIDAYIREETETRTAEAKERRALYPWSNRIIAAGFCMERDEAVVVLTANADAMEVSLLKELAHAISDGRSVLPIITFNGRNFDLPTLMSRARLLGVPFPRLNLDRFRNPNRDILIDEWCYGDPRVVPMRSLKWVAKRLGLNTDDAFSGKEIAQLYQDGNWDAIRKHVESDVTLTRQIAERLGVLRPRPVLVA